MTPREVGGMAKGESLFSKFLLCVWSYLVLYIVTYYSEFCFKIRQIIILIDIFIAVVLKKLCCSF